jgi:hypothetical protein
MPTVSAVTIPRQHVTVRLAPLVAVQLAAEAHRRGLPLTEFCTMVLGTTAYRTAVAQEDLHRRRSDTATALRLALKYGPPIDNPRPVTI